MNLYHTAPAIYLHALVENPGRKNFYSWNLIDRKVGTILYDNQQDQPYVSEINTDPSINANQYYTTVKHNT